MEIRPNQDLGSGYFYVGIDVLTDESVKEIKGAVLAKTKSKPESRDVILHVAVLNTVDFAELDESEDVIALAEKYQEVLIAELRERSNGKLVK